MFLFLFLTFAGDFHLVYKQRAADCSLELGSLTARREYHGEAVAVACQYFGVEFGDVVEVEFELRPSLSLVYMPGEGFCYNLTAGEHVASVQIEGVALGIGVLEHDGVDVALVCSSRYGVAQTVLEGLARSVFVVAFKLQRLVVDGVVGTVAEVRAL